MKRKIIALLTMIAFVISMFPFAAFADEPTIDQEIVVSTVGDLGVAVQTANNDSDRTYAIVLDADLDFQKGNLSVNGAKIVLEGNGHTINNVGTISVLNGANLTLGSSDGSDALVLSGVTNNDQPGIIHVNGSESVVTMNDGVTLKDHKGDNYFGGGVTITGGTFNMNGGTIENCGIASGSTCYGGGVAVIEGGTFNMNGGTIKDCYVSSESTDNYYTTVLKYSPQQFPNTAGGGVYVSYRSTFNFNGGTIEGCESAFYGGGVMIADSRGNTMGNLNSRFTMSGDATITDCLADFAGAGIAVLGMTCAASPIGNPNFDNNSTLQGSGIYINGGNIIDNAAGNYGGGIFVRMVRGSGSTNIEGVTIDSNSALNGGGIAVANYWTQANIKNATIVDNVAQQKGAGIYLVGNSSGDGTTVDGSTITGNLSGDAGAGIYYDQNSKLKMTGAVTVQDNYRFEGEYGPYVGDYSPDLKDISEGTLNNVNVLRLDKPIYIIGDLTGSKIGVTDPALAAGGTTSTERLTSSYKTNNDSLLPYNAFTSDHDTWYPYYGEGNYANEVRLVQSTYTLHYNDGVTEDKVVYYDPTDIKDLETPTQEGKTFDGWYKNADFSGDRVNATPDSYSAETIDLYAKWIDQHKVTLLLDGGEFAQTPEGMTAEDDGSYTKNVEDGDTFDKIANPTRDGYEFNGWYAVDEDGTMSEDPYDFTTPVTDNLTLKAGWTKLHNVKLVLDNGEFDQIPFGMEQDNDGNYSATVVDGDTFDKIANPTRDGYEFNGWYAVDEDGTMSENPYDFTTPVTDDLTLKAGWTKLHNVKLVLNNGEFDQIPFGMEQDNDGNYNATVVNGDTFDQTADPTREGYVFDGWYAVNADGSLSDTAFDFTTPITADTTLQAQWTALRTVSYDLNEGAFDEVPADLTENEDGTYSKDVKDQTTITAPANPTRRGYTFSGWYAVDADGNISDTAFDFSTPIIADTTLQAQWKKNSSGGGGGVFQSYVLHYDSNGGTSFADERYSAGASVSLTKVPARTGYTFTGWYSDEALSEVITSVTMTASTTVYAGWEATEVPDDLNGDDHFAYVVGYEDGTVRPEGKITRAETATIFFRLLKDEVRDGNLTSVNSFVDVEDGLWYNKPVSTLAKLDIIKGVTPTQFNPDASITRAEFAAICARFDDSDVVIGDSHFSDTNGHWAEAEIERAVSLGWISGYEDGTFRPNQSITRAEAMSIINRVLNRLPENADDLLSGMHIWSDNRSSAWYYLAVQEATNSHEFERKSNGVNETWTALTDNPDWSRYM